MISDPKFDATSCKQAPGLFAPVIDRNRCEGKGDCLTVCPVDVFSLGTLDKAERSNLTLVGKIKGFAHGWKQAFTPNVHACEACGLCVGACPEKAITLKRNEPGHRGAQR
nr:ferredoxin family protein [Stutzerimonas nitrititolerans]